MRECRFDNRIRTPSLIIPEKFFINQEVVNEEFMANGKKCSRKTIKKTETNIPSLGWEIETVTLEDNSNTYPWRVYGKAIQSEQPVAVVVPLPMIAIEQRIWRFYAFRLTLSDILQEKILSVLNGTNIFEKSLLKSKIIGNCIDIPESGTTKLEIEVHEKMLWISISKISAIKRGKAIDQKLFAKADRIKSYIANL